MGTKIFDDEILEYKKPGGCICKIFQLFYCQQAYGGRQFSEESYRSNNPSVAQAQVHPKMDSLSCNLYENQSMRSERNTRPSMESSEESFSSSLASFPSLAHSGRLQRNLTRTKSLDIDKSPSLKEIIKESINKYFRIEEVGDEKRNIAINPMEQSSISVLDESVGKVFMLEDFHRFSCDGRDAFKAFNDAKEFGMHKGVPRLSLDSKESLKMSELSPKNVCIFKKIDKSEDKIIPVTSIRPQNQESNDQTLSIVAKLMGLEILNSSTVANSFNEHKNKVAAKDRKQMPSNNDLKSPSKVPMKLPHVQKNMNQRIYIVEKEDFHKLIETKNNYKKSSLLNSFSMPPTLQNYKREMKSPIGIIAPARRQHVYFSKATERMQRFQKIQQNELLRIQTKEEQNSAENKSECKRRYSLSKDPSGRAENSTTRPRLRQLKYDMSKKVSASISSFDSNKSPQKIISSPVLSRCNLVKRLGTKQDSELQNSGKGNVEAIRSHSSSSKYKVYVLKKQPAILKDLYDKELNPVSPRESSPKSVPGSLFNKNGSPRSPAPITKAFKEQENMQSNQDFIKRHLYLTLSSKNGSNKPENEDAQIHCSRDLGIETNKNHGEMPTRALHKDPDQKSNLQKLVFDTVNEVIAQNMKETIIGDQYADKLSSTSPSNKHLEIFWLEVKYLRSYLRESSQARNSFETEIPDIVLGIERLIFRDLINEVLGGRIAASLVSKKMHVRKPFENENI